MVTGAVNGRAEEHGRGLRSAVVALVGWAWLGAVVLCVWGCNQPLPQYRHLPTPETLRAERQATTQRSQPLVLGVAEPYRIQVGDLLAIRFFYEDRLDDEVRVRPDGRISLVPVNDVDAAGLTPEELDAELTERFATFVQKPDLSVIVREFAAQRVFVGGEVRRPGVVPLEGNTTVLAAVLAAGGPMTSAELHSVLLLRPGAGNECHALRVDVQSIIDSGEGDVLLTGYDVVYVPRTIISEVGLFVEQYVNRLVPRALGFQLLYDVNPEVLVADDNANLLFNRVNTR